MKNHWLPLSLTLGLVICLAPFFYPSKPEARSKPRPTRSIHKSTAPASPLPDPPPAVPVVSPEPIVLAKAATQPPGLPPVTDPLELELLALIKRPPLSTEEYHRLCKYVATTAQTDPVKAADFIFRIPAGSLRKNLLRVMAQNLKLYPDEELPRLINRTDGENETFYVVVTLLERISDNGRFQGDYVKLARWYESKVSGVEQRSRINSLFAAYVFDGDFVKACDWLLSVDENTAAVTDFHAISAANMGADNMDKALFVLELLRSFKPARYEAALPHFVDRFRSRDAEACFTWTLQLSPSTQSRNKLIGSAFSQMTVNDPKIAEAHLNQVTDPALKAELAQTYREFMDFLSKHPLGR